jgi:hypothetical protein
VTDNLPAEVRQDVRAEANRVVERATDAALAMPHPSLQLAAQARRRQLPANAYVQTGLGELPLSSRLRDAVRMLSDVLLPLVDNFEALTPQPLLCSVCGRNFGGWPQRVLEDHYFQHTWLQRRLAGAGIR